MTSNDSQVGQLIINLIENKEVFKSLIEKGLIANQIYLNTDDNSDPIVSVNYETGTSPKLTYTSEEGNIVDIITIANLKTALELSTVASNGQYTSLSSKPSINNVELVGNKTTSDLGIVLNYESTSITNKPSINSVTLNGALTTSDLNISYRDLDDLPTIPNVTSDYVAGNTTNAITASGVEQALANYVHKTRTVTGTGALSGGGELSSNISITHNAGPNGLPTAAVKVGVDSYGHACLGATITAQDVNAQSYNYDVVYSASNLNLSDVNSVVITGTTDETFSISGSPKMGYPYTIYYVNGSENQITLTIPNNMFNNLYINGTKVKSSYLLQVQTETVKKIELTVYSQSSQINGFIYIS